MKLWVVGLFFHCGQLEQFRFEVWEELSPLNLKNLGTRGIHVVVPPCCAQESCESLRGKGARGDVADGFTGCRLRLRRNPEGPRPQTRGGSRVCRVGGSGLRFQDSGIGCQGP